MDDKKGEIIDWLLPLSLLCFIILFFVLEHKNIKDFQRNTELIQEQLSISGWDSPKRADAGEEFRFIDTDASDAEMQKELYKRFYFINEDTYFAYQVKRVGEAVSYFSYQLVPSGANCSACQSIKVISAEQSSEYPGIDLKEGYCALAVTVQFTNLCETDFLWLPVTTKVGILNDTSTFVRNEYGSTFASVLQEYDSGQQFYVYSPGSEGENVYAPENGDSEIIPKYIYIRPQESVTYKLIYEIPEELIDEKQLAVGDDTSAINGNYCNSGYRFYINQ